jgi:hypothetical protein
MTEHEATLDCTVAKYGHQNGCDDIDSDKHADCVKNRWALRLQLQSVRCNQPTPGKHTAVIFRYRTVAIGAKKDVEAIKATYTSLGEIILLIILKFNDMLQT